MQRDVVCHGCLFAPFTCRTETVARIINDCRHHRYLVPWSHPPSQPRQQQPLTAYPHSGPVWTSGNSKWTFIQSHGLADELPQLDHVHERADEREESESPGEISEAGGAGQTQAAFLGVEVQEYLVRRAYAVCREGHHAAGL